MKDRIFLEILPFFKNLKYNHFLLACSGGPDSLCLFYLMHKLRLNFSVLYIDHSWRKESEKEAVILKDSIGCHVPFYVRKVEGFDFSKGNIEDRLRQERLKFYFEVAGAIGADAIVTGHQRDDRIETTLKRLLEGAHLTEVYGMKKVEKGKIDLLRPLLGVSKKAILDWLKQRELSYFEDPTNEDERYLRARMRRSLIPQIEQGFGKQIEGNLYEIAERSLDLKEYLDRKIEPYLSKIDFNKEELWIDFSEGPFEKLERSHLIRRVAKERGIVMSRNQIETALRPKGKKLLVGPFILVSPQ
jgi:tRNA(Ile)-lysidine synthase